MTDFLAADWGTSNLRAWRLGADGTVKDVRRLPWGVAHLGPGEAARKLKEELRPALGAERLPAILCGMVGSNLGWTSVPYLDCPVGLDELTRGLAKEVVLWKECDDPLLYLERRAYLDAIQDALAGVESARVVLAPARQRIALSSADRG